MGQPQATPELAFPEEQRRPRTGSSATFSPADSGTFTSTANTREGRRNHVGASADLKTVAAEIKEQVRVLDGLVRFRFGENAELMGAWASARNVLGPFKSKDGQTPKAA